MILSTGLPIFSTPFSQGSFQAAKPIHHHLSIIMDRHCSHPQTDGKVNHHQVSRDLFFHLFGDCYRLLFRHVDFDLQHVSIRSFKQNLAAVPVMDLLQQGYKNCQQPLGSPGDRKKWEVNSKMEVDQEKLGVCTLRSKIGDLKQLEWRLNPPKVGVKEP